MTVRRKVALLAATLALVSTLAACGPNTTPAEPSPAEPTSAPAPTGEAEGPIAPSQVDVGVALAAIDWPSEEAVARVNGVDIATKTFREEVTRQLRLVTAQYQVDWNEQANLDQLPTLLDSELERLITMEVLNQVAAGEGISISEADVQSEAETIRQEILTGGRYQTVDEFMETNELTQERFNAMVRDQMMINRMIEAHGGPTEVEQVHARHILVDDEAKAKEVQDKLAAGEAFEDLAKIYSTDTGTRDVGGDLGWFPRGMMVPEFEQVAFSLETGHTSEPVKSDFGYHIIRVEEREVRALEEPILSQVRENTFMKWLDEQQQAANIERLYTPLPKTAPTAQP